MTTSSSSSRFTKEAGAGQPFGPPMIGALLRMPWQAVQRHMLQRLHEQGFDDLDAAHLPVFQYPGPQGRRPSELAAQLGISKQALNYLLRELERLDYLTRQPDPDDQRSKRITLTPRGTNAIHTIRNAVSELEHTWQTELGTERFTQLQTLLHDLNQLTHAA